ncbi:MAG: ComF family protein [Bacteroidales bacterium]|nr:ComF family protein [Bacteroidales bacterium]
MNGLKYSARALRELFFPRVCPVCGEKLEVEEPFLCGKCLEDIPFTWTWAWPENPVEERMWKRVGIVAGASLFFYRKEGGYGELVRKIKYGGDAALGRWLGRELGRRMAGSGRFSEVQAVVPVPLHPLRRWRRGYNQAEIIAQGIAAGLGGLKVEKHLLRRRKYTRTQTKLTTEGRSANVKDAFAVNPRTAARLSREGILNILVVDDVLTSGATLSEAVKPLLPAFAVSVATAGLVE